MPPVAIGVGILGAGYMAKRAQDRAAAQMRNIAQPGLAAQAYALPRLRELIEGVMMPQLNVRDPALGLQHQMNLAGIGKVERVGEAEARFTYGSAGNIGRARGEVLRLREAAEEMKGRERLNYGMAEEQQRQLKVAGVASALESLAGLGAPSMEVGMQAAQTQAQGQVNFARDLASLIGGVGGMYMPEEYKWPWQSFLQGRWGP